MPALRAVARQLDSKIGDIRKDLYDITKVGSAKSDAIAVINQGRNPVSHSAGYDAFKSNAMAILKPFLWQFLSHSGQFEKSQDLYVHPSQIKFPPLMTELGIGARCMMVVVQFFSTD